MTTRERSLAIIVGSTLGVFALGFLAYQLVIGPYVEKGRQLRDRQAEVDALEAEMLEIQMLKRKYEASRQQSLPADVGVSRTQYGNLLERLFRRADMTTDLKIIPSEPDNKSVPKLDQAQKKPAYTRLTYAITAKGELYHLVDFLRHFYQQPLLHRVKDMNIQRPSDMRAQGRRELDINMTVEALVLDNAPARSTLLPVIREMGLLSGGAAQTGYNMQAATSGHGSPVPPSDVLAEPAREYLAVAGKDFFFGPPPTRYEPKAKLDDDHSPFITLTSIVGHDDGSITAVFRDKLDNHNYTIIQEPNGSLSVVGEYELRGTWRTVRGYTAEKGKGGHVLFYGSDEAQNYQSWRVRRVTLNEVILEKLDGVEKPKPPALAFVGGGIGNVLAVPEGKMYRVVVGQTLHIDSKDEKFPPPTRFLLTKEAWKAVYAPGPVWASILSADDRAESTNTDERAGK
jgi:hypothetical protein